MKKKLFFSLSMLAAFVLWTWAVCTLDVQAVGPIDSSVGFATINNAFHHLTGVHMALYVITDWLGLVPVLFGLGFAIFGLIQWIRRKRLTRVDASLQILGGFYIVVLAVYLLFEEFVVNYRPVLINGYLEASYPSSTTMLVLCVMPTAMMQLHARIRNICVRRIVSISIAVFIVFMVVGRLISGVHWFTDIVGGVLLSSGLVGMYGYICVLRR